MTQSKHTPGPWEAVERSGAGWQIDAKLPAGFKFDSTARDFTGSDPAFMLWTLRASMNIQIADERWVQFETGPWAEMQAANARLIAAAPTQHEEMVRFLPIIERAEADPELWAKLTAGTGIATANAYRAAIARATGDA